MAAGRPAIFPCLSSVPPSPNPHPPPPSKIDLHPRLSRGLVVDSPRGGWRNRWSKRHAPARTGARPGSRQDEAWLLSLALNGYWEVTFPQNRRSEPTDLRPRGPISQGIGSEADRVWLETAAPPVFGKG